MAVLEFPEVVLDGGDVLLPLERIPLEESPSPIRPVDPAPERAAPVPLPDSWLSWAEFCEMTFGCRYHFSVVLGVAFDDEAVEFPDVLAT